MHIARKVTLTLFVAQALSATAFLASATVTSIVGAELGGRPEWAGLPAAVYQLGVAVASLALGFLMDRFGRRVALGGAFLLGAVGSAMAAWAISAQSFSMFLGGLAIIGPANAAAALSRFVAAEVHPPHERGRAIANVVIGSTVATLVWPVISILAGPRLSASGMGDLAWPYWICLVLLVLTSVVLFVFLRPDPKEIAAAVGGASAQTRSDAAAPMWQIVARPGAAIAILSMVIPHTVMVMVMVITSLHMRQHDHSVQAISLTISLHVLGMFGFSIFSGRLADRLGRAPVIAFGAAVVAAACLVAPLSPAFVPITFGLFLLGLGWNFCFVGGSSLLSDQLLPDERARAQGFNDLLMGLVSAIGSVLSGQVFAAVGYRGMGLAAGIVALVPLALAVWAWRRATNPRLTT